MLAANRGEKKLSKINCNEMLHARPRVFIVHLPTVIALHFTEADVHDWKESNVALFWSAAPDQSITTYKVAAKYGCVNQALVREAVL